MDERAKYVHKRKSKYMAQILEAFEQQIERHLPPDARGDVQDFKGLVRGRMNALAVDCQDLFQQQDAVINGVAQAFRDSLSPTGRP